MIKIQVGDLVPAFNSQTQGGEAFSLDNLKGSPTVLYFYPKDNTSGCTLEAKSLRDGKEELKRRCYKIVGVSPDSEKSHTNFCTKH
ncbi:MAG: peroxiredoxin, partial [Alistipes sp.]|nr:peroxiredoxin [Alistipes sp.]